jgi:hypothetical protein
MENRQRKEIIIGQDFDKISRRVNVTAYLGLFDAEKYMDSLAKQIQSQSLTLPLVIVDNASTDATWRLLHLWPLEILSRSVIVRNPKNLGGLGSLYSNLDRIQTKWFATLHQDDRYLPHHLETLSRAIDTTKDKSVLVHFTDMGTLDTLSGKEVQTPVRPTWIQENWTKEGSFQANLRLQTVSYPSAAFLLDSFKRVTVPWHSTTFPDAEITLRQSCEGSFNYIRKKTMLYGVNPQSESNDLENPERVLGSFSSLSRVMASEEFMRLCSSVVKSEQSDFAQGIFNGIDSRLGAGPLASMVKLVAAESMALTWNYSESLTNKFTAEMYSLAGSRRTSELLESLLSKPTSENLAGLQIEENLRAEIRKLLDIQSVGASNLGSKSQKAILRLLSVTVPLKLRRTIVGKAVSWFARKTSNKTWDFNWKK